MPARVYSPDPCFPKWDWESQTSLPWKRDTLCAVPGRPTNSRSRKPHGEKPARQSARHTANGPSVTVLHGEVSSCPIPGCGVSLSYPRPQGPGHRTVRCTAAPPSCSPAPEGVGRHDPFLCDRLPRMESRTHVWKPLNTAVAGQALRMLAGSFAERCSPCKLSLTASSASRHCVSAGWRVGALPRTRSRQHRRAAAPLPQR